MNERRIKDVLLERFLAKDLDPATTEKLVVVLEQSSADRTRLEELTANSQAFLAAHPPGPLVARFEERHERKRWTLAFSVLAPALAAAALAIVYVRPAENPVSLEAAVSYKGDALTLRLYVKRGSSTNALGPGGSLRPGDQVRFEVRAPRAGHVAVLSRDPRGEVAVYYPFGAASSAPYDPGQPLFPGAVELDEATGTEEFLAIFSQSSLVLGPLVDAIHAGKPVEPLLPRGASVARLAVQKKP